MENASVIEIVTFTSKPEFSDDDVIRRAAIIGDVLFAQAGFVGRYFSKAIDGSWLITNFWTELGVIEAGNKNAQAAPEAQLMFEVMEMSSVFIRAYEIQTGPENPASK